jgi:hypothetical protein
MNAEITVIGYLVLVAIGFGLWAWGRLRPQHIAPLGDLIDRMVSRRRTRLALLAIWWWLGWHFFSNVALSSLVL